jgi:Cof subfamily protein (haloacid dehalogenase superfamily)
MDGTLLNRQSLVSRDNQQALRGFVAEGGRFTLATGRSDRAVKPYLKDLPVNAPAILCNGALIYDFKTGHHLAEFYLAEEIREILTAVLERFPEVAVQVYQSDHTYFLRHNAITKAYMEQLSPGTIPEPYLMEQLPWPWLKALLIGKPEQLAMAESFLKAESLPFNMVYSEVRYLELLPEGVSKGRALEDLLRRPEYTGLKTIALGDNPNDLEMIATADLGIAVGNAHPDVKRVAKWIACDHDSNAVAEVIERLRRVLEKDCSEGDVLERMMA